MILCLNAGSSSLKFALYEQGSELVCRVRGQVEGFSREARLKAHVRGDVLDVGLGEKGRVSSPAEAFPIVWDLCQGALDGDMISVVAHRIVHGGQRFDGPVLLDDEVHEALKAFIPLAPLHQPFGLAVYEASRRLAPEALQVACFDTAFHAHHRFEDQAFALPRAYFDEGVRRYGFHGLSYGAICDRLKTDAPELLNARIVIAHLGSGCSMCALHEGQSVASTMGFSALEGLIMGTRCGQIDPGVLLYLLEQKGMSSKQVSELLYKQSGLLGLSGLASDLRDLEASDHPDAASAIAYLVNQVAGEIGRFTARLGGLDGLIFTAGMGENSARLRQGVVERLSWLRAGLDQEANQGAALGLHDRDTVRISSSDSALSILVMHTDEEWHMAQEALGQLKADG